MAVLFRDDFVGAAGPLHGRVTDGATWDVVGGDFALDGAGSVTETSSGSARLALSSGVFAESTTIDFEVRLSRLYGYSCPGIEIATATGYSTPPNPGVRTELDAYYSSGVHALVEGTDAIIADTSVIPADGVPFLLRVRMTTGSADGEVYINDVLVGYAPLASGVMSAFNVGFYINVISLFGLTMDYVEVRDQSSGEPPGPAVPFWTDFISSHEIP